MFSLNTWKYILKNKKENLATKLFQYWRFSKNHPLSDASRRHRKITAHKDDLPYGIQVKGQITNNTKLRDAKC